ncbi:DNA-binding protein [Psychroflexus sp. MES1-P1E]|nr:DNA-binding protein [Psychroflexus sp. MES1-P1E]
MKIPTVNTIKYLLDPIIKKLDHLDSTIKNSNSLSSESKYYRNSDLKKLFGLSSNTIIKYRETGLLPYTKLGEIFLYEKKKIDSILKENSVNL